MKASPNQSKISLSGHQIFYHNQNLYFSTFLLFDYKCLLGSKYGECPLPNYLDEAEFKHIRNEAFEGGKGS